jgi:hypothetical protein
MALNSSAEPQRITNGDLLLADIPKPDSDWGDILPFAHSFDGYMVMGSFEACATVANQRRHDTLTELRTCLFFEARRWRHFGEDPDPSEMEYIHGLLNQIRDKIAAGQKS